MMLLSKDLIDRRSPRLRFPVGRLGGERGRGAVKVGVDSRFVGADVIDATQDQQFVAQRLERFQNAFEAFLLKRRRNSEPEERH